MIFYSELDPFRALEESAVRGAKEAVAEMMATTISASLPSPTPSEAPSDAANLTPSLASPSVAAASMATGTMEGDDPTEGGASTMGETLTSGLTGAGLDQTDGVSQNPGDDATGANLRGIEEEEAAPSPLPPDIEAAQKALQRLEDCVKNGAGLSVVDCLLLEESFFKSVFGFG